MAAPRRSSAGRASAAKKYVISSDEDEDPKPNAASAKKGKGTMTSKKSRRKAGDSDDDFAGDEDEEDGEEDDEDEDAMDIESEDTSSKAESEDENDEGGNAFAALMTSSRKKTGSSTAAKKTGKNQFARGQSNNKAEDGGKGAALDKSLPPLSDLGEIFKDLVGKLEDELVEVCDTLDGRKLRVGTMCSGTESPLLALGLISESLEELTGRKLDVEHIFSCEIEPFKQAYIERNFAPPLLFRDVTELGDEQAKTAYGGIADVPGNIDMLVAGTSCVDYSPLNVKKKTIDEKGESGRTFFGMLDYVQKHQPPIVILENVSGAPWDEVVVKFQSIDYTAVYMRLDTKHFYIPHTRMRAYLIAVPKSSGQKVVEDWAKRMKTLVRPCSSPLEAFLLPTDDPRIHRARQDLSKITMTKDGVKRAPTDWIRCEGRHAQAREQENLGLQRPLTAWKDNGGAPTMPDGAWNDWASAQTERVWDLMDISYMRLADQKNTDVSYKSALWNLSQNVDRQTANPILGISSCLTPNMIAYLASRGGPIIGLEALALQGLPIDKLLLTRENTDQLADLAGNAMSSTVVGSAILAALVVARKTLLRNHKTDDVEMEDAESTEKVGVEGRIRGDDRLVEHFVDLASSARLPEGFLEMAARTARKCICEGRTSTTPADVTIHVCEACSHSCCANCVARPDHRYQLDLGSRANPDTFIVELKKVLPMRFALAGFDINSLRRKLDQLKQAGVPLDQSKSAYYKRIAEAVDGAEFHFSDFVRRREWSVIFSTELAKLELRITRLGYEWSLRVDCDPSLAVESPLRKLLEAPVARMTLGADVTNLLDGQWDIGVAVEGVDHPSKKLKSGLLSVEIDSVGEMVPSWRASMGLVLHLEEKRPSRIRVTMSADLAPLVDRSLDGIYELEDKCGTACHSLYRRVEPAEEKPLYFFFDPTRFEEAEVDAFVFSDNCDRLEYGQHRNILASLTPKFRLPTEPCEGERVPVSVSAVWSNLEGSRIVQGSQNAVDATFSTLSTTFDLTGDATACSFADNLLSASVVQSPPTKALKWAKKDWHEVDLQHEGPEVFSKIAWMLTKIPAWDALREWQVITGDLQLKCDTCCPPAPTIHWIKRSEQKARIVQTSIIAVEDGQQAATFERALKSRPSPLLVHTRQTDTHFEFRVGLNAATLAHRALRTLPTNSLHAYEMSAPTVEWRLKSSNGVELGFGKDAEATTFTIPSNDKDASADQPPHFQRIKLRPEQLRSLHWMIEQESKPEPWVEEEVAEAILPQLGWHAEAKASRKVSVRGGVLADAVGYGKTAITVALISARLKATDLPVETDRIPVKGTLIVVPAHLILQWPEEIKKFTKGAAKPFKVLIVKDLGELRRKTVADFREADIIVVAETLFNSALYWPQLGDWSGSDKGVKYDQKAGRYFRTCVDEAIAALPDQITRLVNNDAKGVWDAIKQARRSRNKAQDIVDEPSKRLKGQAAIFAEEAAEAAKKNGQKADKKKAESRSSDKKEAQVGADPWDLDSSGVRKKWESMKSPPLSIFSFERLVIDEFTYTDGPQLAAVHAIRARSRWILSGTPPLESFAQVKSIANLLHVHLGVDDESEYQGGNRSSRYKEKTAAEQFHSFRDVHTVGWHKNRDGIAQRFLNQFARQNWADTKAIKYSKEIVMIDLPAAEMAIYRELEHHLLALSTDLGKIQRIKKEKRGDREMRLSEALGNSKSPEEALLKRCSHFSMDLEAIDESTKHLGASGVCERILMKRVEQLDDCEDQFLKLLKVCAHQQRVCDERKWYQGEFGAKGSEPQHFRAFLQSVHGKPQDKEGSAAIQRFCAEVGCAGGVVSKKAATPDFDEPELQAYKANMEAFLAKNGEVWDEEKDRLVKGKEVPKDEYRKSKTWMLRQNVSAVERLRKELIGRYRSKRYFECVRNVQRSANDTYKNVTILSCCGHTGPSDEIAELVRVPRCIDDQCDARVSVNNIVRAETLGNDQSSGTYGVKLETLVKIIQNVIPKKDRILVFVQFEDLFDKTKEALEANGIKTAVVTGSAKKKGDTLQSFQKPGKTDHRVLLLQVTDKSASGANLTVANWAFFVSPLLTDTTQEYKAFETQAIGRLRRYGQLKPVKVFRLMTRSTIDIQTFEQRTGKIVDDLVAAQPSRDLDNLGHLDNDNGDDDDTVDDEDEDADSEDAGPKKKQVVRKAPSVIKKTVRVPAQRKRKVVESDESESEEEEEDEEEEEEEVKRKVSPAAKKRKSIGLTKRSMAIESDDEIDIIDAGSVPAPVPARVPAVAPIPVTAPGVRASTSGAKNTSTWTTSSPKKSSPSKSPPTTKIIYTPIASSPKKLLPSKPSTIMKAPISAEEQKKKKKDTIAPPNSIPAADTVKRTKSLAGWLVKAPVSSAAQILAPANKKKNDHFTLEIKLLPTRQRAPSASSVASSSSSSDVAKALRAPISTTDTPLDEIEDPLESTDDVVVAARDVVGKGLVTDSSMTDGEATLWK